MKKIILTATAFTAACLGLAAETVWDNLNGGLPIANFAISAQAPQDGSLFGHVVCNSGKLGDWLDDCGTVEISVIKDGKEIRLNEFPQKSISRDFPIIDNTYSAPGISLHISAFCPIVEQNLDETALPVILMDIKANGDFTLRIESDTEKLTVSSDAEETADDKGRCLEINIRGQKHFHAAVSHYDGAWNSARRFGDAKAIADYAMSRCRSLMKATARFHKALPFTGNPAVDHFLPYYMLPALVLTRTTSSGELLTMGYCEFNQRDSFWTSWMHLVHFRDAEWKMICESYDAMREDGKIPTCIMPVIEREDDLDINLFLLLRTARFHAFHGAAGDVEKLWPKMKKVMDWVIGRDLDGFGLPQQVSFWGDWKDTRYMEDRKYSPFVGCLYLASLDQMIKMAVEFGDEDAAGIYRAVYDKAWSKMNADVEDGGLWNGRFYAQIGKDGKAWEHIAQDQMVGVLYGVIPPERAESIMNALNEISMTQWGICNMYPYMEDAVDGPGLYHNGGIWPWMSFLDCWARITAGREDEALDIMGRIFQADIIDSGDFVPNEYIDSLHGENKGFYIQGWNADLYGLMYFGLKHKDKSFILK